MTVLPDGTVLYDKEYRNSVLYGMLAEEGGCP